jgi:hypothetical protein
MKLEWLEILQVCSVVLGTLMGGPLIASASAERRSKGFLCVATGSACSMLAQLSAGLYILAASNLLWVVMSLKGAYVNLPDERRPRWVRRAVARLA